MHPEPLWKIEIKWPHKQEIVFEPEDCINGLKHLASLSAPDYLSIYFNSTKIFKKIIRLWFGYLIKHDMVWWWPMVSCNTNIKRTRF